MNFIEDMIYFITHFDYMSYTQSILEKITLETFLYALVVYFFVIWIAIIIWVLRDISNRTYNIFYQILSILLVIIGSPLGVFLYLMIRPGKTLFEKEYDDQGPSYEDISDGELQCFECGKHIEAKFVFCPHCAVSLRKKCIECKEEIQANWQNCPYCGTHQTPLKEEDSTQKPSKKEKKKKSPEIIPIEEDIIPSDNHIIPSISREENEKK